MNIETETFGLVTTKWVRGDRSGSRVLRVCSVGRPETVASTRPGKTGGEFLVVLAQKWARADGAISPGFRITSAQFSELQAERELSSPDGPMPLGKTQLWED